MSTTNTTARKNGKSHAPPFTCLEHVYLDHLTQLNSTLSARVLLVEVMRAVLCTNGAGRLYDDEGHFRILKIAPLFGPSNVASIMSRNTYRRALAELVNAGIVTLSRTSHGAIRTRIRLNEITVQKIDGVNSTPSRNDTVDGLNSTPSTGQILHRRRSKNYTTSNTSTYNTPPIHAAADLHDDSREEQNAFLGKAAAP